MSISVIYNKSMLLNVLYFLPLSDIMNCQKLSKIFLEIMKKDNNIWKLIENERLKPNITSLFNTSYDVLQKISWGTQMCCSLCSKSLPLDNIALLICNCNFHPTRNNIYLKYHKNCIYPYIQNTMRNGYYNRGKNATFLCICPICKGQVLGLNCSLY